MAELPRVHEVRHDPLIDRYVIIAEDRALRPGAKVDDNPTLASGSDGGPDADSQKVSSHACPFCPGNEHETPPELFALRAAAPSGENTATHTPDWQVRVVPNKYPAVVLDNFDSSSESTPPFGRHEVIIESSRHVTRTGELSCNELTLVLHVYRDRIRAAKQDPRLRYGLIFKNVGRLAGASIEHLHSQFIATPDVPPLVRQELVGAARFHQSQGQCFFCQTVAQERRAGVRLIAHSAHFVAIAPFAARLSYETWLLPMAHDSHFENCADEDLADLASLMVPIVGRIETLYQPSAYNLLIHTAPWNRSFDRLPVAHYHWHIEIIPRLTIAAGYEWATGCSINTVSPERAAAELRGDVKP